MTENRIDREEELLKINCNLEESLNHVSDVLMKIKEELEEQKKQIKSLELEEEKRIEENEKKVKEVDQEVGNKKGKIANNIAEGYIRLKEIMTQDNCKLGGRLKICQELGLNTDKLIQRMKEEIESMEKNKQKKVK